LYAHHNYSWTIQVLNDKENDVATLDARILSSSLIDINSTVKFFNITYKDTNSIMFSIINPP